LCLNVQVLLNHRRICSHRSPPTLQIYVLSIKLAATLSFWRFNPCIAINIKAAKFHEILFPSMYLVSNQYGDFFEYINASAFQHVSL
jgi:hypothetical protein